MVKGYARLKELHDDAGIAFMDEWPASNPALEKPRLTSLQNLVNCRNLWAHDAAPASKGAFDDGWKTVCALVNMKDDDIPTFPAWGDPFGLSPSTQ